MSKSQQRPPTSSSQNATNWRVRDDSSQSHDAPSSEDRALGLQREGDANASLSTIPATRLYVGNLPYKALSRDVEKLFADGAFSIARIDMSTDPFTGRNPSYCFVDLDSADEARRAIHELNGKEVLGRPVKIKPSVAKESRGSNSRIKTYDRGWRPQRISPEEVNSDSSTPRATFDRWSRSDAAEHWKSVSAQGRRLYVGGLPRIEPQRTVDAEMQVLFKGFVIEAVSKIISPHPSKQALPGNHYYLFVDLPNAEEADAAVNVLDGTPSPWGGTLQISKARGDSRKVTREQYH